LGVDVGNTKTDFLLCGEDGEILAYARKSGANFQSCGGIDMTLKILNEGIEEVSLKSKVDRGKFVTYLGMAGADREADFKLIEKALSKLRLKTFSFQNDGFVGLKSGTVDGKGILITCGTGNTNFASDGEKIERIGGLSQELGDGLGAHMIASKVTSAAVRAKDGRGPKTVLREILEDKLKMEVEDLITVNLRKFDPVPIVVESLFEAVKQFDVVAFSILKDVVEEINKIAELFRTKLFQKEKNVKLILDGSFFKNADAVFFKMLQNYIWNGYKVLVPEHDPVVGAVFLSMENGTREKISKQMAERIVKEYLQIVKRKKG